MDFLWGKKAEDRTEDILRKYLDRDFTVFPMAEGSLRKQDIDSVEKRVGIRLPAEYRAHLLGRFPGVYVEVKEALWPRPQAYDVGPFWTFLYGVHSYTASAESEDWMKLETQARKLLEISGERVMPILKVVGDADVYCVNEKSEVVRFLHEENRFEATGNTFWEILEREIAELKERKTRKAGV